MEGRRLGVQNSLREVWAAANGFSMAVNELLFSMAVKQKLVSMAVNELLLKAVISRLVRSSTSALCSTRALQQAHTTRAGSGRGSEGAL